MKPSDKPAHHPLSYASLLHHEVATDSGGAELLLRVPASNYEEWSAESGRLREYLATHGYKMTKPHLGALMQIPGANSTGLLVYFDI